MKKKDLKVGEVYADVNGKPVRLLSITLWQTRTGWGWVGESGRHPRPALKGGRAGTGPSVRCGRLYLSGVAKEILETVDIPDWMEPELQDVGMDRRFDDRMEEFEKQLPPGVRMYVENTAKWRGLYEEVSKSDRAAQEDYEKRHAEAVQIRKERNERYEVVQDRLLQYGIDRISANYDYVDMRRSSERDRKLYVTGVTQVAMKLEDLEKLLGIKTEEQ